MQAPVKQLVCVKWGSAYGPEYVNRLYGMVSRHLTPPFRLVCLTDDRSGIRAEVECFDLPELGVPHPQRTVGKWRKQVLWGATVPGLTTGEPALFIDLDSVIVGALDDYFDIGAPGDVYVFPQPPPRGAPREEFAKWLNLPAPADPKLPTVWLIGDSTVRNGRSVDSRERMAINASS